MINTKVSPKKSHAKNSEVEINKLRSDMIKVPADVDDEEKEMM